MGSLTKKPNGSCLKYICHSCTARSITLLELNNLIQASVVYSYFHGNLLYKEECSHMAATYTLDDLRTLNTEIDAFLYT